MNKELLGMIIPQPTEIEIRDLCRGKKEELGFDIEKALFPVNPLMIETKISVDDAVILLKVWNSVRDSVSDSAMNSISDSAMNSISDSVMDSVWNSVWNSVRDSVRDSAMNSVRDSVSDSVWNSVRNSVRNSVSDSVWDSVSDSVRNSVRDSVWAYLSSMFYKIEKWDGFDHDPGVNPFQSCIDLWESGYVASFDGNYWRLHTGEKANVVWEQKNVTHWMPLPEPPKTL